MSSMVDLDPMVEPGQEAPTDWIPGQRLETEPDEPNIQRGLE